MIKKYYKMRKGRMYLIKEKSFHSRWHEQIYRFRLGISGWKLEELITEAYEG
ncbi:MAG: hypothetical protein ACOYVK_14300 [Bacillota bacterium]